MEGVGEWAKIVKVGNNRALVTGTGCIVENGGCVVGRWGVHSISHHSLSRFAGLTLLLGQLLQLVHLGEDVETCCKVGVLIEAMATLLYV